MNADALRTSDRVPLLGVEEVERDGKGKTVTDAWLVLEERHGPTPARRVVSLQTQDGAIYRFQRYRTDEYLAYYDRQNPDGEQFQRQAPLPAHVEAVRDAIVAREVLPDFDAMTRAEEQVGDDDPDGEATDEQVRQAVVSAEESDAGDSTGNFSKATPRAEQARTDGGSHADVVAEQLAVLDADGEGGDT